MSFSTLYFGSSWRTDTIVFARLNNPLPPPLNREISWTSSYRYRKPENHNTQNNWSAFTPESSVREKREMSIVQARAWASRAKWDWVLKRNQYGGGVDTPNTFVFKLDTK